jgi:transposase-like protein
MVRESAKRHASLTCPTCGKWFRTAKGAKAHHTRMHPPSIEEIVARRGRGESLLGIGQALGISPQSVLNLLNRSTQEAAA